MAESHVTEMIDDLHDPGSGVKWSNARGSDGNLIHLAQACVIYSLQAGLM